MYAHHAIYDDVLLFYNDVSLSKVLGTDDIVKRMVKLFNIDSVQVASLYMEMQKQGEGLTGNNFMHDLSKRLGIASSKEEESKTSPKLRKDSSNQVSKKQQIASTALMKILLTSVPDPSKSLPDLDAI